MKNIEIRIIFFDVFLLYFEFLYQFGKLSFKTIVNMSKFRILDGHDRKL